MRQPIEIKLTKRNGYCFTRAVTPNGIYWGGYIFELPRDLPAEVWKRGRVLVSEDHGELIIISDYTSGSLYSGTQPKGPLYPCKVIGIGRPTNQRINALKQHKTT